MAQIAPKIADPGFDLHDCINIIPADGCNCHIKKSPLHCYTQYEENIERDIELIDLLNVFLSHLFYKHPLKNLQ